MTGQETRTVTACSVAGGGWLIRTDGRAAEWVDAAACRIALPEETARIAALGRELILRHRRGAGVLPPEEISWLLALPRRIACLVDFLTAPEELAWVLTTPITVTFAASGEVRWRFGGPEPTPGVAAVPPPFGRWPMAAENRLSIVCPVRATKG
jgi:hypothetical protein